MEMSTKVNGKMIKLTGTEFTCMLMELGMKAVGKRISNMEKESRDGQMVLFMKVCILMGRSTGEVDSSGAIILYLKENSKTIILKARALTDGMTVECTMETGKTTKCTVKEFSHGQMEENTQGLTLKT